MNKGLDFEVVKLKADEGFQIWTPDESGACIGSGKTESEARIDATLNMAAAIVDLCMEVQTS